jgi:uncharacterized protein YciI
VSSYFTVFATDRPGTEEVRARVRHIHRVYLRAPRDHAVIVRLGGPTFGPDGRTMNGTLLVVQAESIEDVERFVHDDPYVRNDLFESIVIRRWHWGLGNPDARL